MLIEMIDGEPPYFNMAACDAMTCLRDLPPPHPRNTDNVSNLLYKAGCYSNYNFILGHLKQITYSL